MSRTKLALKILLGVAMIGVGILHFVRPDGFVKIVPSYLPSPLALVYVSGFFEVLGGAGLLVPRTQRAAAWGLVLLYLAVFPANVNMALHGIQLDDQHPVPVAALWLRLPLQLLLIAWAWWYTRDAQGLTPAAVARTGADARNP
jgi:uncharacterized membrane protein